MTTHHFVAASARFLTEEEPLDEVLKERRRHYGEQGKEIDFWLVLFLRECNLAQLLVVEVYGGQKPLIRKH